MTASDRFFWTYNAPLRLDDETTGGEKWRLIERNAHGDNLPLATLIRLPGSMTRIFATQYATDHYNVPSTTDHAAPLQAWFFLIELVGELPRLPGRSDEAHSRAISLGKLAGRDYSTGPNRDESPKDPYTGAELDL